MKSFVRVAVAIAVLGAGAASAQAAGPVDFELAAGYWVTDMTFEGPGIGFSEGDGGGVLRGALWVGKFGARGGIFGTNALSDAYYSHLEAAWKPVSVTRNNYLAIGLGWQRNKYGSGDSASASGPRVSADGRVGLVGIVYFYGEVAYYPSLGDIHVASGDVTDLSGREYEVGVTVHPWPFLFFRAGYRDAETKGDFVTAGENLGRTTVSSTGFLVTANFAF